MKKYFLGNEVSSEGVKAGFVDFKALAKSFNAVLCNEIINSNFIDEAELVNGSQFCKDEDGKERYIEIYQWYFVDDQGANILQVYTNEILYYISSLDVYVWGITHYGTSWDIVLTNIKI